MRFVVTIAGIVALAIPHDSMQCQTRASLSGIVWDSAQASPVVGASVRIVQLDRDARTDTTGRFRLGPMSPGRYTLAIRRMGYPPLDTIVDVSGDAVAIIRVTASAQPLARVNVTDAANVSERMAGFEARRKQGHGKFMTQEELEKVADRQLSDVVVRLGGSLRLIRNRGAAFLMNVQQQNAGALREGIEIPDMSRMKRPILTMELEGGRSRPCLVQIFVDGLRIFGQSADTNDVPPSLDEFLIRDLQGIEFYSSPSTTPLQYQSTTAQCGTLAIWTRER